MPTIKNPRQVALLLSMYGALIIFLASTNPRSMPSIALVLPVAWLFACIALTVFWLLPLLNPATLLQGRAKRLTRALLIAGVPSGLLLLQSIDQLTLKDMLLFGFFGVVALAYSRRFQLERKRE